VLRAIPFSRQSAASWMSARPRWLHWHGLSPPRTQKNSGPITALSRKGVTGSGVQLSGL
jgi:hypothetical protein